MVLTLKPLVDQSASPLVSDLLAALPTEPPGLTPFEAWHAIGSVWAPATIAAHLGRLAAVGQVTTTGQRGRRRYWREDQAHANRPPPPTIADAAAADQAWTLSCIDCDHTSGVLARDLAVAFGSRLVSDLPQVLWCAHCGSRVAVAPR